MGENIDVDNFVDELSSREGTLLTRQQSKITGTAKSLEFTLDQFSSIPLISSRM